MQRRHDPADISAAAQEYLLALRVMGSDGRVATTARARPPRRGDDPGRERDVPPARGGRPRRARDGPGLALTAAGRAAADAIFRRHALLEWLLTSVVGLTWAESDVEAMRLQGALSPRVESKLDELLGHPETCPHGNPIDLETSRGDRPAPRCREMESGSKATVLRITEEAEEDAGLLSYLEARALTPGAHDHDPVAERVARLPDPRRAARPGDARPAAGGADPGAARPRRSRPVPQGAGAAGRLSRRRVPGATALQSGHVRQSASASRPAPRGPLHIGTARTALFNYLFARHTGGTFVLRLEDTDVARSTEAFEQRHPRRPPLARASRGTRARPSAGRDEAGPYAPYRQMQRLPDYAAAAARLLADGSRPIPATARPTSSTPTARPRRPRSRRHATSVAARR